MSLKARCFSKRGKSLLRLELLGAAWVYRHTKALKRVGECFC